jgi:hypothetical protein
MALPSLINHLRKGGHMGNRIYRIASWARSEVAE